MVNRIAGVATHIVRTSGFTLQEVRGALLVFCAGCMMYASDSMEVAAGKVSEALGGAPYIGVHTFGEQGQFPDGMNRHGNLMFSCLVISSRRRVIKLLNVDTGKQVPGRGVGSLSPAGSRGVGGVLAVVALVWR